MSLLWFFNLSCLWLCVLCLGLLFLQHVCCNQAKEKVTGSISEGGDVREREAEGKRSQMRLGLQMVPQFCGTLGLKWGESWGPKSWVGNPATFQFTGGDKGIGTYTPN